MADEWSMGEVVRRLDRIEHQLSDLGVRVVSVDLYARDRAEWERRLAEVERALDVERQARKTADEREETTRKEAVKDLRDQVDKQAERQGTSWRQAIYTGVLPSAFFLVTILLQLKSGTGK